MSDGYDTMIGYWIGEGFFDAPYPESIEEPYDPWECLWDPPGLK